jgi:hypothetical protein
LTWKPFTGPDGPKSDALSAGQDSLGNQIYIGRGLVNGVLSPGRLLIEPIGSKPAGLYTESNKTEAYISSGIEYYVKDPNCNYQWVLSSNGTTVDNAIKVFGPIKNYYVGRVFDKGSLQLGKVLLTRALYYPPNNTIYTNYEVLVCNGKSFNHS